MDAVLAFAASMTWKGRSPVVGLMATAYQRGVSLTKAAMAGVEAYLTRLPQLEKWCGYINPVPSTAREVSLFAFP